MQHFGSSWHSPRHPDLWINALHVVEQVTKKKLRLCLACTTPNAHLLYRPFRYDTLPGRRHTFKKGGYFAYLDLESGYHHMRLFDGHRRYLAFVWKSRLYFPTVAMFGISSLCEAFTALLAPWVSRWRALGITCGQYLDDTGITAATQAAVRAAALLVAADLIRAGFLISWKKSDLSGVQDAVHLGLRLDFVAGVFRIPEARLARMLTAAAGLSQALSASPREVAVFLGLVCASSLALGPGVLGLAFYAISFLRSYAPRGVRASNGTSMAGAANNFQWDLRFPTTNFFRSEMRTFVDWFLTGPSQPFFRTAVWQRITRLMSDAGAHGAGGHVTGPDGQTRWFAAPFPDPGLWGLTSSTFRELWALRAVLLALLAAGAILSGACLFVGLDSRAAASIMRGGRTEIEDLHLLRIQIWRILREAGCAARYAWVPRDFNQLADWLSKFRDAFDLQLDPACFRRLAAFCLEQLRLRLEVDRFASAHNAQLPRFWTWFACAEAEGVDSLHAPWSADTWCWCFPPFAILGPFLRGLFESRTAQAVVLLPAWYWQPWWALLFEAPDQPDHRQRSFRRAVRACFRMSGARILERPSFAERNRPRPWQLAAPWLILVVDSRVSDDPAVDLVPWLGPAESRALDVAV